MRAKSRWAQGSVVLSVDAADAAECVEALFERLAQRDLPATFAMADPVASPHRASVVAAHPANELALLCPAAWVAPQARSQVAAELSRLAAAMPAAGRRLTSLVSPGGTLEAHADLLLKRGVSAVQVGQPATSTSRRPWSRWLSVGTAVAANREPRGPRMIRFGLWAFHPHVTLPTSARIARRVFDDATDSGGACHVTIDAAALDRSGRSALAALDGVLDDVARRQAAGTLAVATLADAVRALRPSGAPAAESILRSRAA